MEVSKWQPFPISWYVWVVFIWFSLLWGIPLMVRDMCGFFLPSQVDYLLWFTYLGCCSPNTPKKWIVSLIQKSCCAQSSRLLNLFWISQNMLNLHFRKPPERSLKIQSVRCPNGVHQLPKICWIFFRKKNPKTPHQNPACVDLPSSKNGVSLSILLSFSSLPKSGADAPFSQLKSGWVLKPKLWWCLSPNQNHVISSTSIQKIPVLISTQKFWCLCSLPKISDFSLPKSCFFNLLEKIRFSHLMHAIIPTKSDSIHSPLMVHVDASKILQTAALPIVSWIPFLNQNTSSFPMQQPELPCKNKIRIK